MFVTQRYYSSRQGFCLLPVGLVGPGGLGIGGKAPGRKGQGFLGVHALQPHGIGSGQQQLPRRLLGIPGTAGVPGSLRRFQGGCGGCGGGCASGGCAGCSGCGGGAEREPYVETRTFTDIVTLTSENFQTEVLDDPGLILIDFWAEWCQPCRMLAPAFEELNREEPQVKFCRVNVDEQGELAQMFGIESIPTLAVVQDRHTLTGSVGLRSKEEIKAMLDGCK